MKKINLVFLLVLALFSCKQEPEKIDIALNLASGNSEELKVVLDRYKRHRADSLKYKAAVFLIENMAYHYSYKPLPGFEPAFDSIAKCPLNDTRKKIFRSILSTASQSSPLAAPELIPDVNNVSSPFLMHNIDLSFEAWSRIPGNKRASFDDFCNYILPYKSSDEPVESSVRDSLRKKYSWVNRNLEAGASLQSVVDSVAAEFHFEIVQEIRDFYPQTLSVSQMEKTRFGLCDDGVNYLVNVFRAVGIVSAKDMTPHWGNHPSLGHSWLYVKYGNEEYSTDVAGKINLKSLYLTESIPKISRETFAFNGKNRFSPFTKDVTSEYVPVADIIIPSSLKNNHSGPVLCVFDVDEKWYPISAGTFKDGNFKFHQAGVNVMYLAANQDKNGNQPINYPFFLDSKRRIHYYKPSKTVFKSIILTRKCRLSSPRNRRIKEWIKNINGAVIQGANHSDFSDAATLYTVSNFNSTQIKAVSLKSHKKFKYVRFYSNGKETYLAKLSFYDREKKLYGSVIKQNNRDFKWENGAFDDDPLSFSGGKDFALGLEFKAPQRVTAIDFQIRNDNNHINVGDKYELFYWDREWKTLGRKVASDTVLNYKNVPANSLLWLRNKTSGNEEHIFVADGNNRQRWPGSDN